MKKLVTIEDYQRRKLELETLIAISPYLEEFFQIIRMAPNQEECIKQVALRFNLSQEQAKYILSRRLKYITSLIHVKLQKEYDKVIQHLTNSRE